MTTGKLRGPRPNEGSPRFPCPDCTRSFSARGVLRNHRINEHNWIPPTPAEKRSRTAQPKSVASAKRPVLIARVGAGEKYLEVAHDLGVASATAYGWVNAAIDAGELNPPDEHLVPRMRLTRTKNAALRAILADPEMNLKEAAEVLHIPYSTAQSYKAKWNAEDRVLEAQAAAERAENPEPVRYEDLSKQARTWLDDFALFRRHVLHREWDPPWAVIAVDELLELYHSEEDEYVVVNAPPGVGKTTLISHDFVLWVITLERAKGLEPTVLLGHKAMDKARWYVKRIRATMEYNRTLISLYGRFRSRDRSLDWSQDQVAIELICERIEKEPTIAASSYDASLLSGRFKLNVWDDLIDKTNSSTVEQREHLNDWWEQTAESRVEPGGLTILSNARYGPEDLSWSVRQVLDAEDLDETTGEATAIYHHIAFKAHYEELCTGEHHGNYPDGCLLDERRLSWRRMRKARQNELRFELVFQQADVDPKGFLAQRIWFDGGTDAQGFVAPGCFKYDMRFGKLPEGRRGNEDRPILSAVTLDPSSAKYWAAGHWLAWGDRVHQLYRGKRAKMQAPDILYSERPGEWSGLLEDWWQASNDEGVPFTYLVVEENAAQRWLMQYPFFQEWAMVRGVTLVRHGTNRSNKPDPDRGVEMNRPIYQAGRCWLPYLGMEERIFSDQFRREACSWPEGQSDDIVMMHWFLTHRLDQLLGIQIAEFAEAAAPDENVPGFVQHRKTPRWADRRARSLTSASEMAS